MTKTDLIPQTTLYPLGDQAIILQFAQEISETLHHQVGAVCGFLEEYSFNGFREYVPAYASVTIFFDPLVLDHVEVEELLREMLEDIDWSAAFDPAEILEIPVCYAEEFAPDLAFVASSTGLSKQEVIRRHAAGHYLVHMVGFVPGFPYLGGMDPLLATPRKATPAARVAPGSVGIAGNQTGIYSIESPGGWQIIGRTPLKLFDIHRAHPALLTAGSTVNFVEISIQEYYRLHGN